MSTFPAVLLVTQTAAPVAISNGDTAWVLMASALVLLMVPGLAFFYGGLVRNKSALNTADGCVHWARSILRAEQSCTSAQA